MHKRAMCVGINNYPFNNNDLNGCVNDALAWARLLVERFGFSEVHLLVDAAAKKANILTEARELLAEAQAGDVLVYTFAGHGAYVADAGGDEERYAEAHCSYDCADNLILDDEWRTLLADLPEDVHLTVIADACFSGSVLRGVDDEPPARPVARCERFLNPDTLGGAALDFPWAAQAKARREKVEM